MSTPKRRISPNDRSIRQVPRHEIWSGAYLGMSIPTWLWTSDTDEDVIATVFAHIAQHGPMTVCEIQDFLGQRFVTVGQHSMRRKFRGREIVISDAVSSFLARIVGRALREMQAELVADDRDGSRFLVRLAGVRNHKGRSINPWSLFLRDVDGRRSPLPSSNGLTVFPYEMAG